MTQNTAQEVETEQASANGFTETESATSQSATSRFCMNAAEAVFQRSGLVWAFFLLALLGIAATNQSANKLFWWDELASYDIAQLPHSNDVWNFFKAGLDTPSPVPTLIVQAELQSVGKSEVRARLPFELGFPSCASASTLSPSAVTA
jgi:hypothetical protein